MSGRPVTPDPGSEPGFLAMSRRLGAVRSLPEPFKPPALPAIVAEYLVTETKPPTQPTPDSNVASRR